MQKINLINYEKEIVNLLKERKTKLGKTMYRLALDTKLAHPTINTVFKEGKIGNLATLILLLNELDLELYIKPKN